MGAYHLLESTTTSRSEWSATYDNDGLTMCLKLPGSTIPDAFLSPFQNNLIWADWLAGDLNWNASAILAGKFEVLQSVLTRCDVGRTPNGGFQPGEGDEFRAPSIFCDGGFVTKGKGKRGEFCAPSSIFCDDEFVKVNSIHRVTSAMGGSKREFDDLRDVFF